MEFNFEDNRIIFDRKLSELDNFVIEFAGILDLLGIKYAIVSGYVSIVFGRSRQTEDVDIIIESLSNEKFELFWKKMLEKFECMNTDDPHEAFADYLNEKSSLRFLIKNEPIPNIELKIVSDDDDQYTLENSIELILNKNKLSISPIEFQIIYKMRLGSEKDLEDAKHLFNIFSTSLNRAKLIEFIRLFNIEEKPIKEYLKGLQWNCQK